jgi:zinc transport system substrate-binding protein
VGIARHCCALAAVIGSAFLLVACGGSGSAPSSAPPAPPAGPKVVAATTWEAGFAKAAGAQNVQVIVPPSIQHAPDYDPKPSDLAAVSDADIVLYAPFEGFADKLKQATGSKAKLVQVNLDNSPNNVHDQITKLAATFGTQNAAAQWLQQYDAVIKDSSDRIHAAWRGGQPPKVVAETFETYMSGIAGAQVVGTYGPNPPNPSQLAQLAGTHPDLVLDNYHMTTGTVLPDAANKQIELTNFPGPDLDLLTVYRHDTDLIVQALRS